MVFLRWLAAELVSRSRLTECSGFARICSGPVWVACSVKPEENSVEPIEAQITVENCRTQRVQPISAAAAGLRLARLTETFGRNIVQSKVPDSEATVEPAVGLYFGAATIYGLVGWGVLQGRESNTVNWVGSVVGIILFAILAVTEKKLSSRIRLSLNYGGYLFTALSIIYLGYRMWASV